MTVYIKVPEIVAPIDDDDYDSRGGPVCNGCVFQENGCEEYSKVVGYAACIGHVWIPDTPEAFANYIALKLESS